MAVRRVAGESDPGGGVSRTWDGWEVRGTSRLTLPIPGGRSVGKSSGVSTPGLRCHPDSHVDIRADTHTPELPVTASHGQHRLPWDGRNVPGTVQNEKGPDELPFGVRQTGMLDRQQGRSKTAASRTEHAAGLREHHRGERPLDLAPRTSQTS